MAITKTLTWNYGRPRCNLVVLFATAVFQFLGGYISTFGTATAYLALIAWHRSDLHPLSHVPYANLVTIVVVLPALAFVAGWLLAGREPSTLGHSPLE